MSEKTTGITDQPPQSEVFLELEQLRAFAEEKERILEILLENVPGGVTMVGGEPDFLIIANSRVARELLGRPAEELLGVVSGQHAENYGIFFKDGQTRPTPEQLPLYRATRYGETIKNEEWIIERPTGERITISANVVPIRDEQGKIIGAINCWSDISERKKNEAVLERYQLISARARDIVLMIRQTGEIVEANASATAAYGYTREELQELKIHDLREASTHLRLIEQLKEVAVERGILFETVHRRKDGSTFPVEVSAISAEIAGESLLLSIVRDITGRKRRERNAEFLIDIGEDLARLAGSKEIMRVTSEKIGKFFEAAHCVFTEYDAVANTANVHFDWRRDEGDVSLVGTFPLSDYFSGDFQETILNGMPLAVSDVRTDPWTVARAGNYEVHKIRSFLRTHFLTYGDLKFGIAVNCPEPRKWREDEIELLQELASRIWTGIERRRAEEALRESENTLLTLADSIPQLAWMADKDGFVFWYNRRWYEYTGTDSQQMEGWGWQSVHDPKFLPEVLEQWKHFLTAGDPFEMEFPLRSADGKFRWFLTRVNPVRDLQGRVTRWFGTNTDVHERRIAQMNAEFLAALGVDFARLMHSDELISLAGARIAEYLNLSHCLFVEINEAANEATVFYDNHAPDLPSLAGVYPLPDFHTEDEREELAAGKTLVINDVRHEPRSAVVAERFESLGIRALVTAPYVSDGRWKFALSAQHRYSYQWRKDEIELLEALAARIWARLERAFAEQEREEVLKREQTARTKAEEANRLKDEFLATVSHELRTPLNSILGWAQVLRTRDLNDADAKKALATIERSARSQNQLIEDILDVSRIITGKLRLTVRAVDLSKVISTVIESAQPAAEAKNIQLQILLDPEAGPISGDSDRLQQVVWNLLSNAIKFTPKDGHVQVRLEQVNSNIEIVVSDTGKGIEPEFLPFVFDRFRQSDGSTTRRDGGLGLGLAIVRQLVELHGGTVSVSSAGTEQGATFTVSLPLLPLRQEPVSDLPRVHPTAETGDDISDCPPELTSLRILVVDDEADSRDLLKLVLDSCGAEVIEASSAAEALEKVRSEKFDVLISDIGMPEEDGFSLIRKIRELSNEEGGSVPAIALTAYARAEDRVRALRAGFQMHIPKPVESSELIAVVGNLAGLLRNPNRNENS